MSKIFSKMLIKAPKQHQGYRSGVPIVDSEQVYSDLGSDISVKYWKKLLKVRTLAHLYLNHYRIILNL